MSFFIFHQIQIIKGYWYTLINVMKKIDTKQNMKTYIFLGIVFGEDLGLGQSAANLVEEESKQGKN